MKRVLSLIFLITIKSALWAQSNISGIVNTYTAVTSILTTGTCASAGFTTIAVVSSSGFSVGDKVLVIQMKGATADQTNTSGFGDVTGIGNAGNYEFAIITSIVGSDIVTNPLINSFDVPGLVQLVRVPVYNNATVIGTLTGQAWNGATGGVLAIEVTGTLTVNANITMSGLGYSGGTNIVNGAKSCGYSDYFYDETGVAAFDDHKRAAYKGEGIAAFVTQKKLGKGKWTIGGGGGNSQNAGGGGGGNAGAGGRGGRHYDGCASTPSAHGLGGTTVTATAIKLFMGGGGGAGDNDDTYGTRGGNGGGIVLISAATIMMNNTSISSEGESGPASPAGSESGRDGLGGGGAGGTIAIAASSFTGTALTISTNGGAGSSSSPNSGIWNYHGPGGGGGGGLLWISSGSLPSGITYTTNGGTAGFTRNHDASRSHYEATDGNPGLLRFNFLINTASCSTLPVSLLNFTAALKSNHVLLSWITTSENNSSHFDVMRSYNGSSWTMVGQVAAQGASSSNVAYSFIDEKPESGIVYYGLWQYDFDHRIQKSRIQNVSVGIASSVMVMPNPATEVFTITCESIESGEVVALILINSLGQIVFEEQTISDVLFSKSFNTANYSTGMYSIVLKTKSDIHTSKIQIQ